MLYYKKTLFIWGQISILCYKANCGKWWTMMTKFHTIFLDKEFEMELLGLCYINIYTTKIH